MRICFNSEMISLCLLVVFYKYLRKRTMMAKAFRKMNVKILCAATAGSGNLTKICQLS